MGQKERWECDCRCHTDQEMHHSKPCCEKCKHCGRNVKLIFVADHKIECRPSTSSSDDEGYPPPALVDSVDDDTLLAP